MFIALVKQCSTINNVETVETKLNVHDCLMGDLMSGNIYTQVRETS